MDAQLKFETFKVYSPPKTQLLKWIGNKQKNAKEITSYFPSNFSRYLEPFVGSGAILATIAPSTGIASDVFNPLIDIWKTIQVEPDVVIKWYTERRIQMLNGNKKEVYEKIKASYNLKPNPADFLFLSRSCYGGVIRFRKSDGYMSTPCGIHTPIKSETFKKRVYEWRQRIMNTEFLCQDYKKTFERVKEGDLVYCDPPYSHSQAILYGAQDFDFYELIDYISYAKKKGAFVALSIDGEKKSGAFNAHFNFPKGLFEQSIDINCGVSMLRRFQKRGEKLIGEDVVDRLFLTY